MLYSVALQQIKSAAATVEASAWYVGVKLSNPG